MPAPSAHDEPVATALRARKWCSGVVWGGGFLLAAASICGFAWLVPRLLLPYLVERGVHSLRALERALPRASLVPTEDEFFPLFGPAPESSPARFSAEPQLGRFDGGESPAARSSTSSPGRSKPSAAVPEPGPRVQTLAPLNQRAAAAQVLVWANQRIIPLSRSRPAEAGLPAGLELSGVAGLGLALLDGDRLTHVAGVAVQTRAEVVSQVMAARARGERAVSAGLSRLTAQGPQHFTVVVEQPYLVGPDPAGASAAAETSDSP